MGKNDNIEVRKQKNAPFCKAFDYIAELKDVSDKVLAEMIGSKGPYISMYRAGTKPVPVEVIENLVMISDSELNMEYLRGNSDYMLLRNVPEEELVDAELRRTNPDYDILKARMEAKEKEMDEIRKNCTNQYIDPSSALNTALASQASEIMTLKQTISDMKEQHKRELADKDALIAKSEKLAEERLHRIAELRRFIDSHNLGLPDFPFPVGAAEHKQKQKHL